MNLQITLNGKEVVLAKYETQFPKNVTWHDLEKVNTENQFDLAKKDALKLIHMYLEKECPEMLQESKQIREHLSLLQSI